MNARSILALALLVTLLVTACQQPAPAPTPRPPGPGPAATAPAAKPAAPASTVTRGGTLRIALDNDAATLDPHMGTTIAGDRQLHAAIFDGLLELDKDLNVVPNLAVSWETPNNLTYVFKLRQGVKFHDGTDFNAQAVKFNMDRILDPANNSHQRNNLASVKSVEVVDPYTVRFNLKEPSAPLLAVLTDRTGRIVSPAAVAKYGQDFGRNPVGAGPFQFVEWLKNDHATVKRFTGYWDKDLPYVDQVIYRFIPDGSVKVTELKTGNLDLVDNVEPKDVASLRAMPDLAVSEVPGLGYRGIYVNTGRPPLDNKALRQAIAQAIDREAIQKSIFFGLQGPAVGPITKGGWAFDPNYQGYTRDLAKARAKLAEGGQPNGFKFPLSVYNNPLDIQHAQIIKAQLAEAGIEADLQVGERTALLADMRAKKHVATLSGWSGYPDPDTNVTNHFHSQGGNNTYVGGYKNPQLDELIEKARSTLAIEERKPLYYQIQRIIVEDAPAIFLVSPWVAEVKVTRRNVQGFTHIPDGILRPRGLWVKQ